MISKLSKTSGTSTHETLQHNQFCPASTMGRTTSYTSLPLTVEKAPKKSKKPKQFSKHKLAIFFAEFVGTGILVFLGCMGCINGVDESLATHHMSSLSFGLVVMMVIQVEQTATNLLSQRL